LDPQRVHELIDFYHAVEHLGKVAALRQSCGLCNWNWLALNRADGV
jgi:hypothetical protein